MLRTKKPADCDLENSPLGWQKRGMKWRATGQETPKTLKKVKRSQSRHL